MENMIITSNTIDMPDENITDLKNAEDLTTTDSGNVEDLSSR